MSLVVIESEVIGQDTSGKSGQSSYELPGSGEKYVIPKVLARSTLVHGKLHGESSQILVKFFLKEIILVSTNGYKIV